MVNFMLCTDFTTITIMFKKHDCWKGGKAQSEGMVTHGGGAPVGRPGEAPVGRPVRKRLPGTEVSWEGKACVQRMAAPHPDPG